MNYTELDVWNYSRELVKKVYVLSDSFLKDRLERVLEQVTSYKELRNGFINYFKSKK